MKEIVIEKASLTLNQQINKLVDAFNELKFDINIEGRLIDNDDPSNLLTDRE